MGVSYSFLYEDRRQTVIEFIPALGQVRQKPDSLGWPIQRRKTFKVGRLERIYYADATQDSKYIGKSLNSNKII
ncbi:MAG: hypothetical protein DMG06_19800 [Acidobacteria bacterium]|nr:MAG: hypothetical protein DMG06_19800 [Acidobacteriota bacterium]